MNTQPDVWYRRLFQAAAPVLESLDATPYPRVQTGARAIDRFLLARYRRASPPDAADQSDWKPPHSSMDLDFWSRLTVGAKPPVDSVSSHGPLAPHRPHDVIEIWTETELSALHAAWWFGLEAPHWSRRVFEAARWHVEHTQPDNATGLPWAIHVMVDLACTEADSGAELFAQTLLHNCLIDGGHPDRRAALILHDAASALETKYASR